MNQVVEAESQRSTAQLSVGLQLAVFLEKLDSGLEQQRQALSAAEARLIEKKALCAAFPDTLPMAPYSVDVTPNGYKAEAELVFEVTTRDEVLQLLDAFQALPAMILSSGCTSFIAEERFTVADAGTKVEPIGDVVYRIAHWVDVPQEEYSWWTRLAGKLVHVLAKTKKGQAVCSKVRSTVKILSPSLREVTYSYENLPDGAVLTWHGGDLRSMAPLTVHQPRGRSFRDALAKPMVAYAKVNARSCDC
jgi:hypothetical protein